ncbi:hypothetical protein C8F04DRAFT_1181535 [Mycena alexandri]|uniref:Uncharacterized protein n=1 Tax=Mycena alexandri TaxID=1745969 RepID=A0AAD6SYZ5_9AGAR|nr:hypothetical protein C8F04DRAFT_1181535 [Mycena alexandri]
MYLPTTVVYPPHTGTTNVTFPPLVAHVHSAAMDEWVTSTASAACVLEGKRKPTSGCYQRVCELRDRKRVLHGSHCRRWRTSTWSRKGAEGDGAGAGEAEDEDGGNGGAKVGENGLEGEAEELSSIELGRDWARRGTKKRSGVGLGSGGLNRMQVPVDAPQCPIFPPLFLFSGAWSVSRTCPDLSALKSIYKSILLVQFRGELISHETKRSWARKTRIPVGTFLGLHELFWTVQSNHCAQFWLQLVQGLTANLPWFLVNGPRGRCSGRLVNLMLLSECRSIKTHDSPHPFLNLTFYLFPGLKPPFLWTASSTISASHPREDYT